MTLFKDTKQGDVFQHGRTTYFRIEDVKVITGRAGSHKVRNAVVTHTYDIPGFSGPKVGDLVFFPNEEIIEIIPLLPEKS